MARADRLKPKQPRVAVKNSPQKLEKRPRRAPERGHNVEKVAWRTGWMDHGGHWDWSNIEKEKFVEILQKLGHWEQKTWAQIMAEDPTNQHDVEVPAMIKDAQDRLVEKNLDDYDSLFRFRFSGRERLWGVRAENIFYLLWWDPEHEVCPSVLRNT